MIHTFKRVRMILCIMTMLVLNATVLPGQDNTDWMMKGKYGIFMHYQYRIMLGYKTPAMPDASEASPEEFNALVDGFDVEGFARQMELGGVSWVLLCLDDTHFGYTCSPNSTFDKYTDYKPGERCSHRDLPMELADALDPKGIRLMLYWSGLASTDASGSVKYFGYAGDPKAMYGVKNQSFSTDPEKRRIALEILQVWVDRYKDKVSGWWFDGFDRPSGNGWQDSGPSPTMLDLDRVVRSGNPQSVIAFNIGGTRNAFKRRSVIQDYTAGDVYYTAGNPGGGGLGPFSPEKTPAEGGILWNAKPFLGNIYYGLGTGLSYSDQTVIDWLKTINSQGGVATLDYPFHPETGLIKDFAMEQLINIAKAINPGETTSVE